MRVLRQSNISAHNIRGRDSRENSRDVIRIRCRRRSVDDVIRSRDVICHHHQFIIAIIIIIIIIIISRLSSRRRRRSGV